MDDAASWRAPMDDVRAAEMDGVRVAEIDDFGVMDGQLGRGSAMGGQVRGSRRHFLLRSVRVESGRGFVAGREIDRGLFKKIANRCGQPGEFRAVESRIHSQRFNVYVHHLTMCTGYVKLFGYMLMQVSCCANSCNKQVVACESQQVGYYFSYLKNSSKLRSSNYHPSQVRASLRKP
jgi:hypothetical protein